MLGNLFPNTFGGNGNSDGQGQLTSGTRFDLRGRERETMQGAGQLPSEATLADVTKTATTRGQMEAQIPIQKRLSEEKQGLMDAALQVLDIRVNHAQQTMQKEDRYQKSISKHGKNYLAHTVNEQANQANFTGYEAEFQAASQAVGF